MISEGQAVNAFTILTLSEAKHAEKMYRNTKVINRILMVMFVWSFPLIGRERLALAIGATLVGVVLFGVALYCRKVYQHWSDFAQQVATNTLTEKQAELLIRLDNAYRRSLGQSHIDRLMLLITNSEELIYVVSIWSMVALIGAA